MSRSTYVVFLLLVTIINILFFCFDNSDDEENSKTELYLNDSVPGETILKPLQYNKGDSIIVIEFGLPARQHVCLEILDSFEKKVETLVDDTLSAGYHPISWNTTGQRGGTYNYRLITDSFTQTGMLSLDGE